MVAAKKATQSWTQFWKGERMSFNEVMKLATTYFARQLVKRYSLTSKHTAFDYGCGPGFLVDHLSKLNISVSGADINPFFIEECRRNHPGMTFIQTSPNVADAKRQLESEFHSKTFDIVAMLSISQYFSSLNEFEEVVKMLMNYSGKTGKLVVADVLDSRTSSYRDGLGLLAHCIRHGKIISFVRFMVFVTSSSYAKLFKDSKLLEIPEDFIRSMCERTGLVYEKVAGLTIHPSRTNYIFSKPS